MQSVSTASGQMALHDWGDGDPPLLSLHGFTLTGAMFDRFASHLGRRVVAPDLPGHGATTIDPVTLETSLEALGATLETVGPCPVLGYSLGGRLALHLATLRPRSVTALVVVSAGPGFTQPERSVRRRADEELARRIEQVGLEAFIDEWSRHPLVGTEDLDPQERIRDRTLRLANTTTGLASALRGLGQGAVPAVDITRLEMPVLWVSGSADHRYTELARASARIGGGSHGVLDSGHNVVAHRPSDLADQVQRFLATHNR